MARSIRQLHSIDSEENDFIQNMIIIMASKESTWICFSNHFFSDRSGILQIPSNTIKSPPYHSLLRWISIACRNANMVSLKQPFVLKWLHCFNPSFKNLPHAHTGLNINSSYPKVCTSINIWLLSRLRNGFQYNMVVILCRSIYS